MTGEQKAAVIRLRTDGVTYSDIAQRLNLSINTVKSFYRRFKDTTDGSISAVCKCCGKPIVQPTGTRTKLFCSDKCRMNWWNCHRDEACKKAIYNYRCECCGKQFQAYGNKHRKNGITQIEPIWCKNVPILYQISITDPIWVKNAPILAQYIF